MEHEARCVKRDTGKKFEIKKYLFGTGGSEFINDLTTNLFVGIL